MKTLEGLTLFFPCFNEEANVERVMNQAIEAASKVTDNFEVIIVDDGSRDQTAERVAQRSQSDSRVRLIRHEINRGYGEALKSGFRAATKEWVFYSDGDGQFDLNELPSLVEKAASADVVSGFRVKRADPWHRKLNARIFGLALRLFMGLDIPDIDCAFKLYKRKLFDSIQLNTSGALIDAEILAKALRRGYRIDVVGVSHRPRQAGIQTGAKLRVIFRAMKEFCTLWWELNRPGQPHA